MTEYLSANEIECEFGAYVTCALWSSLDDNGEPLDESYDVDDIEAETLQEMRAEFDDFLDAVAERNDDDILVWVREFGIGQIGHDFWLTRNRHGAGFWDRSYGDNAITRAGERLTEIAHTLGSYELYVSDDGKVYGA